MLGKHVLEGGLPHGVARTPMPRVDEAGRAVSGWTGQQAGSPAVSGGADDALRRP